MELIQWHEQLVINKKKTYIYRWENRKKNFLIFFRRNEGED